MPQCSNLALAGLVTGEVRSVEAAMRINSRWSMLYVHSSSSNSISGASGQAAAGNNGGTTGYVTKHDNYSERLCGDNVDLKASIVNQ